MQKRFAYTVALSFALFSASTCARDLPCFLSEAPISVGQAVEIQFALGADHYARGPANETGLGEFRDLQFSYYSGATRKVGPLTLRDGAEIIISIYHHSCTLRVVARGASRGILVIEHFAFPGLSSSTRYEFVPAVEAKE